MQTLPKRRNGGSYRVKRVRECFDSGYWNTSTRRFRIARKKNDWLSNSIGPWRASRISSSTRGNDSSNLSCWIWRASSRKRHGNGRIPRLRPSQRRRRHTRGSARAIETYVLIYRIFIITKHHTTSSTLSFSRNLSHAANEQNFLSKTMTTDMLSQPKPVPRVSGARHLSQSSSQI